MRKRTLSVRSRSGSVLPRANLSNNATIYLDQQFSWPPAYALTRNRNKSWSRMQSPSCALAKDFSSKTWAKLPSKALVTRSALMPPHGSSELDRFYLQLIADFSGRILVRHIIALLIGVSSGIGSIAL